MAPANGASEWGQRMGTVFEASPMQCPVVGHQRNDRPRGLVLFFAGIELDFDARNLRDVDGGFQ